MTAPIDNSELTQKVADYLMDDVMDARLMVQDVPLFLDHVESLFKEYGKRERIDAYADCGSKGGSGTVVRAYAKSRAYELSQPLNERSE